MYIFGWNYQVNPISYPWFSSTYTDVIVPGNQFFLFSKTEQNRSVLFLQKKELISRNSGSSTNRLNSCIRNWVDLVLSTKNIHVKNICLGLSSDILVIITARFLILLNLLLLIKAENQWPARNLVFANFLGTVVYLWYSLSFNSDFSPEALKYWVGVQRGHSYLIRRRCLFSLGWPPF